MKPKLIDTSTRLESKSDCGWIEWVVMAAVFGVLFFLWTS